MLTMSTTRCFFIATPVNVCFELTVVFGLGIMCSSQLSFPIAVCEGAGQAVLETIESEHSSRNFAALGFPGPNNHPEDDDHRGDFEYELAALLSDGLERDD
jgi:hypothetical protein